MNVVGEERTLLRAMEEALAAVRPRVRSAHGSVFGAAVADSIATRDSRLTTAREVLSHIIEPSRAEPSRPTCVRMPAVKAPASRGRSRPPASPPEPSPPAPLAALICKTRTAAARLGLAALLAALALPAAVEAGTYDFPENSARRVAAFPHVAGAEWSLAGPDAGHFEVGAGVPLIACACSAGASCPTMRIPGTRTGTTATN